MLVVGLGAFSRAALAQSAPPISVEREPGAEDCPDTAGLVARVQAIVGRAGSSQDTTPYRVTFSRGPQAFTAAIRSGPDDATVRFLDAREPNCAALAHATAIALAVLFDADLAGTDGAGAGKASTEPEASASQSGAKPATPAERPVQKPPPHGSDALETRELSSPGPRVDPLLALGGAAVVGVLRPIGLAFVLDLGLEIKDFRATLGALWVPPETFALPPGSAREHLISGTLRVCYALLHPQSARFDLCSGVLVGGESAEARGFSQNDPAHTELFLAFPIELAISARSRFLGWELSASALVPYKPNEFNVDGVGLTYRPPPVAGMLALRVFVEPLR
ncbi:MAG TPA: hypothetical protein VK745_27345 [Polyangiaceae bacterium]|jgi:hypothetical protein|nr:hypothetical protein [Polyangiaceae bacterium]